MIEYTTFNSPIGKIYIAAVKEGVVKISFSNESSEELENYCQKHLESEVHKGSDFTKYGVNFLNIIVALDLILLFYLTKIKSKLF